MTLFHFIPSSVFSSVHHGSYKDVISRERFLSAQGVEYRQIRMDEDRCCHDYEDIAAVECPAFLIEYTTYPKLIASLRKRFPAAFIAVRSHNLEPLQHLDNHGWWPPRGPVWMFYGILRLFWGDLKVKRSASAIWSISDWENRVYWDRLPGKSRVEWLPYHCPDHLLTTSQCPIGDRRIIACMPTSQKNRKSWDLVTRFLHFADRMKALTGDKYEFVVTGKVGDWGLPASKSVRFTGLIDDLPSLLQQTRAVAMLSDRGYGFKTTIGDALANGAIVLIHPKLAARCPAILSSSLVPCDTAHLHNLNDIAAALEMASSSSVDDVLRLRNRQILLECLRS